MTARWRAVVRLAAWFVLLALSLVWLHRIGHGPMAAPRTWRFGGWLDERDAATAAFALLRVVLLAVGWYLLVATVVATALRLARLGPAAVAVEACSPAAVRRLVRAAVGLTLAASVVAGSAAAASEAAGPVVTMRRMPDGPSGPVTMTRLPDDSSMVPAVPADADTIWTVAVGDHLWAIARRTLMASWHRPPTDREVDPYWRELVEHNRSNLVVPTNADLLVPGQRIDVPPPPAAPAG